MVTMSDTEAARLAADAILRAGTQNVLAIFGDIGLSITRKRLSAFRDAFATARREGQLALRHASSREEARSLTLECLIGEGTRPDCLFAMSDEILAGCVKAVQQSGLSIPQEVSIIAISTGFIPGLFEPEITYVQTDGVSLGRKSFEILHRCFSKSPPVGDWTVDVRLVPGGSLRVGRQPD
jgi:DNA-binding LacI/PurR family transcriptional regulator